MAAGECTQLLPPLPFRGKWYKQAAYSATNCFITENGTCRRGNQEALLQITCCRNVSFLPNNVLSCDELKPATPIAVHLHPLGGIEDIMMHVPVD